MFTLMTYFCDYELFIRELMRKECLDFILKLMDSKDNSFQASYDSVTLLSIMTTFSTRNGKNIHLIMRDNIS
jgi:hypothetical protein